MPQGTPVEARSLFPVTTLAANPPAYPRNPTQKPLEPLVLYIVRVPGSRDVFLSPLKPPTKSSISPEILNASLYFLHVSGPEDEVLLESIERERRVNAHNVQNTRNGQNERNEQDPVQDHGRDAEGGPDPKLTALNLVRRKPVPGVGNETTAASLPTAPSMTADRNQETDDGFRPDLPPRPVRQSYDSGRRTPPPPYSVTAPSRRPLPAPPVEDGELRPPNTPWTSAPDLTERRWSDHAVRQPALNHAIQPPRPIADQPSVGRASWDAARRPPQHPAPTSNGSPRAYRTSYGEPRPSPTSKGSHYTPQEPAGSLPRPFHITLIRRDPTHGNQWNVGTITNSSSTAPSEISADGGITIEITSPGYKRFAVGNDCPLSLESLGMGSQSSLEEWIQTRRPHTADSPSANATLPTGTTTTTAPSAPLRFIRKVGISIPSPSNRGHHRRQSSSDRPNLIHALQTGYPSKSAKGHYTFISPWNGICTFTTGANGRSLRCKHVIPKLTSSLSTATLANGHNDNHAQQAATVAELRFNLPTLGLGSPGSPRKRHGKSFPISAATAAPTSTTDPRHHFSPGSEQEPGRMDLSLAREKAGGGMRGTSAKLGKLIIEDEGLKMLDLVVAACMGVWWGFYDPRQR